MRAVGKAGARRRLSGAAHACDAVSSDRLAGPRLGSCAPADRAAVGRFSRSHFRSACRDALPVTAVGRMSRAAICPSRILRAGLGWSRRSPGRTDPEGLANDTGGLQPTAKALSPPAKFRLRSAASVKVRSSADHFVSRPKSVAGLWPRQWLVIASRRRTRSDFKKLDSSAPVAWVHSKHLGA
jgi:hypothetical protein